MYFLSRNISYIYIFFLIKIINLGRIILLHCELSQHLGQIRLQYLGYKGSFYLMICLYT